MQQAQHAQQGHRAAEGVTCRGWWRLLAVFALWGCSMHSRATMLPRECPVLRQNECFPCKTRHVCTAAAQGETCRGSRGGWQPEVRHEFKQGSVIKLCPTLARKGAGEGGQQVCALL